jgi:hypothetical protein
MRLMILNILTGHLLERLVRLRDYMIKLTPGEDGKKINKKDKTAE